MDPGMDLKLPSESKLHLGIGMLGDGMAGLCSLPGRATCEAPCLKPSVSYAFNTPKAIQTRV